MESQTDETDEIERREKTDWWKLKGITSKTTFRLFQKYAVTKYVKHDKEALQYNKDFQKAYGEKLLESHLQLVLKRKTNFVGQNTLNFALKLVKESVRIDPLKEKLQPYFETLLYEVVIPLMMMSNRDITQFNDDPIEFIRSIFDFLESIFMPKNTTLELQSTLCKFKSDKKKGAKPDYLIPFLNFAADNMKQYNEQLAAGANPDWRIKEALLHSIGNISETISFDKDIVSSIEPMLLTHVLPFLTCDNPYLKHRSCWVYGRFA